MASQDGEQVIAPVIVLELALRQVDREVVLVHPVPKPVQPLGEASEPLVPKKTASVFEIVGGESLRPGTTRVWTGVSRGVLTR